VPVGQALGLDEGAGVHLVGDALLRLLQGVPAGSQAGADDRGADERDRQPWQAGGHAVGQRACRVRWVAPVFPAVPGLGS